MSIENHFEDIQSKIAKKLLSAERQILVAVSWLTDEKLFNILCNQAENLIDVQVLILKDEINFNSDINFEKLLKSGGKLFWQDSLTNNLMHNKFCIIDKRIVITGSYNWTNKAKTNFENIVIIENESESSNNYLKEFIRLVPKFDDAIFYESGYLPAEYFDIPEKRFLWFNKFSQEIKDNLLYYGRELLFKYDEEGYVSFSDDLDENIQAIFKIKKILFHGGDTFEPLENLSNLEDITLSFRKSERLDLNPLRNLINLKSLDIAGNKVLDLTPLSNLKKLKSLKLNATKINSLKGLENLTNLTSLNVSGNNLNSLEEISELTKLESLDISYNEIENIDFLAKNKRLSQLIIDNNKIKDISSLSNCTSLRTFNFRNNLIEDLSPIQNLRSFLFINGTNNPIGKDRVNSFKKNLRGNYYNYNINI